MQDHDCSNTLEAAWTFHILFSKSKDPQVLSNQTNAVHDTDPDTDSDTVPDALPDAVDDAIKTPWLNKDEQQQQDEQDEQEGVLQDLLDKTENLFTVVDIQAAAAAAQQSANFKTLKTSQTQKAMLAWVASLKEFTAHVCSCEAASKSCGALSQTSKSRLEALQAKTRQMVTSFATLCPKCL